MTGGDIRAQTHQVDAQPWRGAEGRGASLDHVVRTTIYLADMADFAAVNDVYGGYFSTPAPARATVQVARLPRDARVEIDAVAHIG